MKSRSILLSILIAGTMILAACSGSAQPAAQAAGAAQAATAPAAQATETAKEQTSSPIMQSDVVGSLQGTLESIYQQVGPSVVNITVQKTTTGVRVTPFGNIPDQSQSQVEEALGSGFVWDTEGHIVTNNHVIDGADTVTVKFADGTTASAKVVAADRNSDLAVIQVDPSNLKLSPVTMGDSTQVKVGQLAIAIGNPFGLAGTQTVGFISALDRSLPVDSTNSSSQASYTIPDIIQTDAAINPGNSGGVLVNDQGEVIGVTSAIESTTNSHAGIGFVIPSSIVEKVVPALIKQGAYEYPWLGLSGLSLTPDLAKEMNLDSNQQGVLVETVTSGGPSDKAGLRGSDKQVTISGSQVAVGGDVIVSINKEPVNVFDDLVGYLLGSTKVGDKVTLGILRDGKEMQLEATLQVRPSETATASATEQAQASTGAAYLGIQGVTMTGDIASAMNLSTDLKGVLVEQVQQGSPADQAGIQGSYKPAIINGETVLIGGDVVTAIDGKAVETMETLRSAIQEMKPGQQITLSLLRGGEKLSVAVTLEASPMQ
ncbi:MAG: trypsin-like peptidase domain-containing protein [Anaerolineaceae bacterium]